MRTFLLHCKKVNQMHGSLENVKQTCAPFFTRGISTIARKDRCLSSASFIKKLVDCVMTRTRPEYLPLFTVSVAKRIDGLFVQFQVCYCVLGI